MCSTTSDELEHNYTYKSHISWIIMAQIMNFFNNNSKRGRCTSTVSDKTPAKKKLQVTLSSPRSYCQNKPTEPFIMSSVKPATHNNTKEENSEWINSR